MTTLLQSFETRLLYCEDPNTVLSEVNTFINSLENKKNSYSSPARRGLLSTALSIQQMALTTIAVFTLETSMGESSIEDVENQLLTLQEKITNLSFIRSSDQYTHLRQYLDGVGKFLSFRKHYEIMMGWMSGNDPLHSSNHIAEMQKWIYDIAHLPLHPFQEDRILAIVCDLVQKMEKTCLEPEIKNLCARREIRPLETLLTQFVDRPEEHLICQILDEYRYSVTRSSQGAFSIA